VDGPLNPNSKIHQALARRYLVITSEQFEALLAWLDADRESAGLKYEVIRTGLLRVFVSKGLSDAEDLADETINRVILRLPDIRDHYCGEPARYFHGVARNIIRETLRRKEIAVEMTAVTMFADPVIGTELECLDVCLRELTPEKRDLILDYYLYEGHEKIEHHKRMASRLGISNGALRGRAHHIRTGLEECTRQCVRQKENKTRCKGH
jgi:DNA-directed RNA polymerase specialized sigma24 family protein